MTRILTTSRRTFLTGGAALVAFGAGPARAGDMTAQEKELYEAAKKEGELNWYTAHSDDITAQALGRDFEQHYPAIRVSVVRTTAQVAFQRVTQELRAGAMQVDVLSSTDIGHYVYLKAKGLLEKFVPDNAAKVLDIYKNYDPDGYYFVTSAGMMAIGYNTTKLAAADAPKSWTDLTDAKWKDKISLGHPGFSGYVGTWVVTMRKLYGWQFFEKMAQNNPQIGRSANDTVTMLNAGERVVSAGPVGTTMQSAQRGNPLAMIYPADGAVLIFAPSGIMKGVRHPQAARLFMNYLLSPEASRIWLENFGETMRPEVAPRAGVVAAKDVKTVTPSVEEITAGIPQVIKQWRETFGV